MPAYCGAFLRAQRDGRTAVSFSQRGVIRRRGYLVNLGSATVGFRLAEDRAAGLAQERRKNGSEESAGEVRRNG